MKKVSETDFQAISPHLRLRTSPRAKRIALRLDTKERCINLVVPKRMRLEKAYSFAVDHQDWIEDKIALLPAPVPVQNGARISLLGRSYIIMITYDPAFRQTRIALDDNTINVRTNQAQPGLRIKRFIKNFARNELGKLAHAKAGEIGCDIKSVSVRDTKSRWGSCGHDGALSFSWRLIFAPYEAIDYVVAHEVAHLKHMNHSPSFWSLCARLSSDYGAGKKWMAQSGSELMAYEF